MFQNTPIQVAPGVRPTTDQTSQSTNQYVFTDKIRFVDGFPETIGGWEKFNFDNNDTAEGCIRSIFTTRNNSRVQALVGSDTKLYSIIGSTLTNITPLSSTTNAIANALDTYYINLSSDPLTTTSGSTTVEVADTATQVAAGDEVTLSGLAATNGVPAGNLNTSHIVRSVSTNSFTISVATAATSTGSGGGASGVLATGIITVNDNAHGLVNGTRIGILNATAVGGIAAVDINTEFIIRNVSTNAFDILTDGLATSSVTSGGGGSTTYQAEIDSGSCDVSFGQGYGMGLYGTGLYGTARLSSNTSTFPRIWFFDRFGNNVVMTEGNGGALYSWDFDTTSAPTVVTNSPSNGINYCFVSNDIVVLLGENQENTITWSDRGSITTWTPAATNKAGSQTVRKAGKFLSHVSVRGTNLLFTENQTYTFRYLPSSSQVWAIDLLDPSIGIISPLARVSYKGVAFWMGVDNFYMWKGGNVEIIPANTMQQSTALKYVFSNINLSQAYKSFAWVNRNFDEIWWHYPSLNSNEPDSVIRLSVRDFSWSIDTFDRTAAESPNAEQKYPLLVSSSNEFFYHEIGISANGEPMPWRLTLPYLDTGTLKGQVNALIPDSIQTASTNISVELSGKSYPQSTGNLATNTLTIAPDSERFASLVNARFLQYDLTGDTTTPQYFRAGNWQHEIKQSSRR